MKLITVFALTLLLTLSSCMKLIFTHLGVLDEKQNPKVVSNGKKQVVYLPMHHIGKQSFYDDVKKKIDSLRKDGYVFYYEGLKLSTSEDSLVIDTLGKKLRKTMGLDIFQLRSNGGYIDTSTGNFMGRKNSFVKKYNLVNQERAGTLMDTTIDRRADVSLNDLIPALEAKLGPIPLDACDYSTPMGQKYTCKKYKLKDYSRAALEYRNKFIADEVRKDANLKIAIVYGAMHFKGLFEDLQAADSTWKKIKVVN